MSFHTRLNRALFAGVAMFSLALDFDRFPVAKLPTFAQAHADQPPCTWNYSTVSGVSTATYCGNVFAPTPPTSDNSTRVATTAFVQASLSSASNSFTTNALLKAYTGMTAGQTIVRQGFYAGGDSEPVFYIYSATNCTLNSGAGDNGSQIQPNSGGGCWNWNPNPGGHTPNVFGAHGDGVTADQTYLQAAHEAASIAGVPLIFESGPNRLYLITASLNFDASAQWIGSFRYGAWSTGSVINTCPWGIVSKTLALGNMVNFSAYTGSVTYVCFDATGNKTTQATAGAAVNFAPATVSGYISGVTFSWNTILNAYDGIDVNGTGYSASCCGKGTIADGNIFAHNTVINPAHIGISNGALTAGSQTAGNTFIDNTIICGVNSMARALYGFALFDGGIYYDGTNNGPLGCQNGLAIVPGSVYNGSTYSAQNAQAVLRGVMGDQNTLHDWLIQPSAPNGTGGIVDFVQADSPWAGATGSVNSVLISCATSGTNCQQISIHNAVVHGGAGYSNGNIMEVDSGPGGPYNFTLDGSDICQFGAPGTNVTALGLNVNTGGAGHFTVIGNRIGENCGGGGGTPATAIGLVIQTGANNGRVIIAHNDISYATTSLAYTPTATDIAVIKDNLGVDEQTGSVAAATSIALPATFTTFGVSGGSTTITTITGAWVGREVNLIPASAQTWATGGNICAAVASTANQFLHARYNSGVSCWNIR